MRKARKFDWQKSSIYIKNKQCNSIPNLNFVMYCCHKPLNPFQSALQHLRKYKRLQEVTMPKWTLGKNQQSLLHFPISAFTWSASESEGTTNTTSPLCKVSSSEFAASKSCSASTCKVVKELNNVRKKNRSNSHSLRICRHLNSISKLIKRKTCTSPGEEKAPEGRKEILSFT